MAIQVYNTLSKRKEIFQPIEPGQVGIYLCGPTVYKKSHIGHAVGPIIFDAISRYLNFRGYQVRLVVNITDVDDKLIVEARNQGRDMVDIAREVEDDYRKAMETLSVRSITDWPRATEYIDAIIELVQKLVDSGSAYAIGGDVYFDHSTKADYGKLSGRNVEDARHGSRQLAGDADKKHPADFAVWKAAKQGEPAWDSPWGKGRPGWHIECSAMSMKLLGETFDIHGGGMDLIFPHHENEIAQSESASGKPFAKYWMHNGLTRIRTKAAGGDVKAEKMSKSIGNIREITSLLEDYNGEIIRAFVLSTQYRRPLDFSDEQLDATATSLKRFYRLFGDILRVTGQDVYETAGDIDLTDGSLLSDMIEADAKGIAAHMQRFMASMDDDFNTAGAIASLHEGVNTANAFLQANKNDQAARTAAILAAMGRILGLFETKPESTTGEVDEAKIQQLIDDRTAARKDRNFARADEVRDELVAMGITIEDTAAGTIWRKS